MSLQTRQSRPTAKMRPALFVALFVLVLALALVMLFEWRTSARAFVSNESPVAAAPSRAKPEAVGCLGHIEPQDGLHQVNATYFNGAPQRVLSLKVREGDEVRAGQLLAVLDGLEQLNSAIHLADARVDLARARLSQVEAGASPYAIAAQKAAVGQIQAALENAQSEYRRFQVLHQQTDVSTAELDARRLAVETHQQALDQAKQRLKDISDVRQTDVDVARSELSVAVAEAEHARLNLKTSMVYAPISGRVVKIYTYPGEEPGSQGILDIAKTSSMYVVAEVYETDISRVHPGQEATITSDLFPGELSGMVESVGSTLAKADVLPGDPVAFADARIFKVWIRLPDGSQVANLIHGKVNVVIKP